MYKTARNDLLRTLASAITTNAGIAGLSAWEIFEAVEPSGLWNALRKNDASNAIASHFQALMRKVVPDFVEHGFANTFS